MASLSGKLNVEVEVKSPADKFWKAIGDSNNLFPKLFPEQYKSIQVVEGDGKSVGSVRIVHFPTEGSPLVTFSKEKIETLDEEKKTVSYSVVDSDLLKFYKNFKATLVMSPKRDGSVVKWESEFEKASEETPEPSFLRDFAVKNFHELDAYLLKA